MTQYFFDIVGHQRSELDYQGQVLPTARGGFGRFCLAANTGYAPPTEMRLRLKPTRYQPNTAASIAPLSIASDCDRGEFLLDGTCRPAVRVAGAFSASAMERVGFPLARALADGSSLVPTKFATVTPAMLSSPGEEAKATARSPTASVPVCSVESIKVSFCAGVPGATAGIAD